MSMYSKYNSITPSAVYGYERMPNLGGENNGFIDDKLAGNYAHCLYLVLNAPKTSHFYWRCFLSGSPHIFVFWFLVDSFQKTKITAVNFSHYVDWVLNGKNTSHFHFLQKPFMYASHWNSFWKFLCGTHRIFPFTRFEIAWTGRKNLKLFGGYDIKYLSIWAFMGYLCFATEKVSKVTVILFWQKNSHEINRGYFWAEI
jgi:hypothetical protein